MSVLSFLVKVNFFESKRKTLPLLQKGYRPHLKISGDDEYLGVVFVDSDDFIYDKEILAVITTIYEGVGYHKLKVGEKFEILEGANIVGAGEVLEESNGTHIQRY